MEENDMRVAMAKLHGYVDLEWKLLLFGRFTKGNRIWDSKEVPCYLSSHDATRLVEIELGLHDITNVTLRNKWLRVTRQILKRRLNRRPTTADLMCMHPSERCEAILRITKTWEKQK